MPKSSALIVDRDRATRKLFSDAFGRRNVTSVAVATAPEAIDELRSRDFTILVVDRETPGFDATGLIETAVRLRPSLVVTVVVAKLSEVHPDDSTTQAAFDTVVRPIAPAEADVAVTRWLEHAAALAERRVLRDRLRGSEGVRQLVGRSRATERLREQLERLTGTEVNVLLVGPEGAGKEYAAKVLHGRSSRGAAPFVVFDCAALPPDVLRRKLFRSPGQPEAGLRASAGATVFLDAVEALDPTTQPVLARAIEAPAAAGVRIVAATTTDLAALAKAGQFDARLLERLSAEQVAVPGLSERRDDLPLLVAHFMESIRAVNRLPRLEISPDAMREIERYSWPGHVRELRNAIEQAAILAVDGKILPRDLPNKVRAASVSTRPAVGADPARSFKEAKREVVEEFERSYLVSLLERHGGNVTAAARSSGMLRSALQRLLRKYDIRSASFRRRESRAERS